MGFASDSHLHSVGFEKALRYIITCGEKVWIMIWLVNQKNIEVEEITGFNNGSNTKSHHVFTPRGYRQNLSPLMGFKFSWERTYYYNSSSNLARGSNNKSCILWPIIAFLIIIRVRILAVGIELIPKVNLFKPFI